MKTKFVALLAIITAFFLAGCGEPQQPEATVESGADASFQYDAIIRGGTVYDGGGQPGAVADIAIADDRIAAVGDLSGATAEMVIDATGKAVAPGFVNMLSWAPASLLEDGQGLSDIAQGVTLEVFGEGWTMGPLPEGEGLPRFVTDILNMDPNEKPPWTTLGEYMEYLERGGVSPNVASFVGATTLRLHQIGQEDRAPTEQEMETMRELTRQAMEEGALGLGSSLIYPPAFFATTEELVELAKVVGEYGGMYISHMRSEGNSIEAAVDELITIAREANIPAEIYHLKFAGKNNWDKFDTIIKKIETARAAGIRITADMYTYPAGGTGLTATMPPWGSDGGLEALRERLRDPQIRAKIIEEMNTPTDEWENMLQSAGAEGILLIGFQNDEFKPYIGKTLAEVAKLRGASPAETAVDLIEQDGSRVEAMYFMMSEENIKKKIALPWVSFGSDAEALAPQGKVLDRPLHPRTYGTFARLLGHYVRDEKVIPLADAIRKLTSFPAETLGIKNRGRLKEGYFADVVVFDPDTIQDHATFEKPHQLSTGVQHVFVNGVRVFKNGEHTGATPGKFVRGPGYHN